MTEQDSSFFPIDNIGQGFLAIMPQPGLQRDAAITIGELARLDVRQVVSLLRPDEVNQLGLQDEEKMVLAQSMRFQSFPIKDLGLPDTSENFMRLSLHLFKQVEAGINTVIHCRAGIGRSGLLAAAVLVQAGWNPSQAFARVTLARGRPVPETAAQGDWLRANLASLQAAAAASEPGTV